MALFRAPVFGFFCLGAACVLGHRLCLRTRVVLGYRTLGLRTGSGLRRQNKSVPFFPPFAAFIFSLADLAAFDFLNCFFYISLSILILVRVSQGKEGW